MSRDLTSKTNVRRQLIVRTTAFVISVLILVAFVYNATEGTSASVKGPTALQIDERIQNATIVRILNNAEVSDLNKLRQGEKQELLLKLYRIPLSGPCVPEIHITCSYDYFLAVSEYDEQPKQSVFHLGTIGEIVSVEWTKDPRPNRAFIRLEIAGYPKLALERNPALDKTTRAYALEVNVNELKLASPPR